MPGGILSVMALLNKQMKVVKAMERYFRHYKEEFFAETSGTYVDLGEPQLTLREYAEYLKAENAPQQ